MEISKKHILGCLSIIISFSGCMGVYNLFAGGGRFIDPLKEEYQVITEYRINHPDTSHLVCQLIKIDEHLAVLDINKVSNSYMLIETHWIDAKGDHFAAWVKGETDDCFAKEFVISPDRQKNGLIYLYPHGQYNILQVDGIFRPVPKRFGKIEPFELIPVNN